ncbi:bifunctional 3-(3-hydroxy-phenyl)propionate/3-hydroxycinnamic acid hydroxylase [Catenulispora yoronensis]|uniref:Bifunctional 3-(3-hydroxy-phenyl)propionate/3-hydroxycinnamic acid hydroxylase n=1 Tax=Catenulispora yoronensis TaxID=450799 RepID=A0ABN2UI60_9ACTN
MTRQQDVIVVGYGPVGMVTAALLGRAGHTVSVVERYTGLYNLPRAASFDDETMRTLAALGVDEALLPDLRAQPDYQWRNASGELLLEQHFAAVGRSGWAEWYMMYQPYLEKALDDLCRSLPNVRVLHASPVTALKYDDHAVAVEVAGTQGPEQLTADYLVACDGGNSFVRQALDIDLDDYGFSEPWMVCDFRLRRPVAIPPALQIGDPAGPTSVISIGRTHHRFSFMLDSEEDFQTQQDPARVWRRVAAYLEPDDADLIRVATYTFRSLIAREWRRGRILLAGDAAHQMPPFLGQGMCSGIRDAQNLAFKLDLVLRAKAGPDILATYQREREPHVRSVTEKGVELGRRQTIRDPELAAERDRALLAAREQTAAAPQALRFPGLADGLFALASGPGRGGLSIQGVVDDGTCRALLDQVVGAGFHLLLMPQAAAALDRTTAERLQEAGVRVISFGREVDDIEGSYTRWFSELGCQAVAVRPDFYVFGTASSAAEVRVLAEELAALTGQ